MGSIFGSGHHGRERDQHVGGAHGCRRRRRLRCGKSGNNVKRFRGGLVFKAHRLLYHSTPSLRVIKKKRRPADGGGRRRRLHSGKRLFSS